MQRFAPSFAALLAAILPAVMPATVRAAERPNVLIIAIDDLRDYLGCYGADFVKSPHIDALAARGTLFERAYCQMALCGPSRSSAFSGLRPDSLRAFGNKTHFRAHWPNLVSLPQHFKQNGYRTKGIGKVLHNTHTDPASWTEPFVYPVDPQYAAKENLGRRALIDGLHPENKANPLFEAPDVPDEAYRDGLSAREARESLRAFAGDKRPFVLFVGFHKPHSPFNAPKRYWDLYERATVPLAPNMFPPRGSPPFASKNSVYLGSFKDMPDDGKFRGELAREVTHAYLACVSYIDALVGGVFATLDEFGLAENTVIALWSDHGYQLGHHDMWCKHSNFETSARIPFILLDPRKAGGVRIQAPVELVDLYPTLADLAGLPAPPHTQGRSLAPAMRDPAAFERFDSVAFTQFNRAGWRGRSLRTKRFRFTEWFNVRKGETLHELYDHESDPLENINRAADPEYVDALKQLKERLRKEWPEALAAPREPSAAEGLIDKTRS